MQITPSINFLPEGCKNSSLSGFSEPEAEESHSVDLEVVGSVVKQGFKELLSIVDVEDGISSDPGQRAEFSELLAFSGNLLLFPPLLALSCTSPVEVIAALSRLATKTKT